MEIITSLQKATVVLLNNIILKEVTAVKAAADIVPTDITKKRTRKIYNE